MRILALLALLSCSPAATTRINEVHNTLCPELLAIEALTLAVLQERNVSEQRINEAHAGFLALQAACAATEPAAAPAGS
jgi:hypothetical protein